MDLAALALPAAAGFRRAGSGSRPNAMHLLKLEVIGTLRYRVEQAFRTMEWRFKLDRARYFRATKTLAQMAWVALGMNLLKALRKLQSGRWQTLAGGASALRRPKGLGDV